MTCPDLRALVDAAPLEGLPALVGALAEAEARALARLHAPAPVPPATGPSQWITLKEAAALLNVNVKWLQRHRDSLPFLREVGGILRVDTAALARWQDRQRA